MSINDPQNWNRFQEALDEHVGDADPIDIHLGQPPNLVLEMGDVRVTWVNAEFTDHEGTPAFMDDEHDMEPEDLPIRGDRMVVETPDDEFEVLIDDR